MFADSALIIKSYEKYSYKELLKVRDDLVEDMRNFENDRFPPDLWHTAEILMGILKLMMEKFCEDDYPPSYHGTDSIPNSIVIKREDEEGALLSVEEYMKQFEHASGDIIEQEINGLLDSIRDLEDNISKTDDKENSKEYDQYMHYQAYLSELENLFYQMN